MSKHSQPVTILPKLREGDEERFASFESWREALKQEWDAKREAIAEQKKSLKQERTTQDTDLINFLNKKLNWYREEFYSGNKEVNQNDIEDLQEYFDNADFKMFLEYTEELDADLTNCFRQNNPASEVVLASYGSELDALRNRAIDLNNRETFAKKHAVSLANQENYTEQYIDALEQNDQKTLQTLEGNKHLHSDITSKYYFNLNERTAPPLQKYQVSASPKSVKFVETRNTAAEFDRSDSPATFMNNDVVGWQNASQRIIAAAQIPTEEKDRNSPIQGILKTSPARIAQEEAARKEAERAKLQAERIERAKQHAEQNAQIWAKFRSNSTTSKDNGGMKL